MHVRVSSCAHVCELMQLKHDRIISRGHAFTSQVNHTLPKYTSPTTHTHTRTETKVMMSTVASVSDGPRRTKSTRTSITQRRRESHGCTRCFCGLARSKWCGGCNVGSSSETGQDCKRQKTKTTDNYLVLWCIYTVSLGM